MSDQRTKYTVDDVDMFSVRNRNEARVAECMREEVEQRKDTYFSEKALQDIYAFALNQLPARYAQGGTIVLREPIRKGAIRKVVREAFELVTKNPKE